MHVLGLIGADNAWDIIKNFGTNGETAIKGIAGVLSMFFVVGGVVKASAKLAALVVHGVIAALFLFILNSVNWLGTVADNTIKNQQGLGTGPAVTAVYQSPQV